VPPSTSSSSESCSEDASAFVRVSIGPRRRGAGFSTTTCALMPPKPMPVTPARSGAPSGHGSALRSTRSAGESPVSTSCGSTVPIEGGSTWLCTAITALIRPATPAAALVWPIIPLIELTAAGGAAGSASLRAAVSARSSVASPTAVPVAWPSNIGTVSMPKPARSYARCRASR
jgi:hypothetical protein